MPAPVYLRAPGTAHPALPGLLAGDAVRALPASAPLPREGLLLECRDGHLALRDLAAPRERPWQVDFASARLRYRRRHGGGLGQTLARAVAVRAGAAPRVIDATAGWGRDAFVLASLGCEVTLIEREAVVAAMLDEALGAARASQDPALAAIAARLRLHHGDGAALLRAIPARLAPAVVYLDPMYPKSAKSAAVKKELRLLRQLTGGEIDAGELLAAARHCASRRVVVKRPAGAAPLAGRAADTAVASASTRYDVYLS